MSMVTPELILQCSSVGSISELKISIEKALKSNKIKYCKSKEEKISLISSWMYNKKFQPRNKRKQGRVSVHGIFGSET